MNRFPVLARDGSDLVHVMAYDGVLFCVQRIGFISCVRVQGPVTCLRCMKNWGGYLGRE